MNGLKVKIGLCLVMILFIVAFIFFYWIREPSRQQAAIARIERESVERGEKFFVNACSACHGPEAEGSVAPSLRGKDPELIRNGVRKGGTIMPAFSSTQITDQNLDDIIAFLNTLK